MKIARVDAYSTACRSNPLLPTRTVGVVLVRVETDDGLVGFGAAGGGFPLARRADPAEVGPFLLGGTRCSPSSSAPRSSSASTPAA